MVIDSDKIATIEKINKAVNDMQANFNFKVANMEIKFGEPVENYDEETGESYIEEDTNEIILYLNDDNLAIVDGMSDNDYSDLMCSMDAVADNFMLSIVALPVDEFKLPKAPTEEIVRAELDFSFKIKDIRKIEINTFEEVPEVTVTLPMHSMRNLTSRSDYYYENFINKFTEKYGAVLYVELYVELEH